MSVDCEVGDFLTGIYVLSLSSSSIIFFNHPLKPTVTDFPAFFMCFHPLSIGIPILCHEAT